MAVKIGVRAIMILEDADVMVCIPLLNTKRYTPKPQAADKKSQPKSLAFGSLILVNIPITSKTTEAIQTLKKPSAKGVKCCIATFENGKAKAQKDIVSSPNRFTFNFLFIYT